MKWWKRCIWGSILCMACVAAGLYAAAVSPDIRGQTAPVQAADTSYIALSSILEQRSYYRLCGHMLIQTQEMPAAYIGLNKEELRAQLSHTSITKFSRDRVILTKNFDCYCPQHLLVYLQEKQLQVYRTVPYTGQAQITEYIPIETDSLPASEWKALKRGKVFANMAAVREYAQEFQGNS